MSKARRTLEQMLAGADIRIDGDRPWDIRVHDQRLFDRVLAKGTLGLGESYMDGWWDCDALDEMIARAMTADIQEHIRPWSILVPHLLARLVNLQRGARAFQVGEQHYDLGNDLFATMLDRRMTYSCGYWARAEDLEAAQEAKLDLICRKIGLQPGQRVLDVGLGWGSFAGYAAEKYGVEVSGVTVSREQAAWVEERYAHLPVRALVRDYRDLEGEYDHAVSVGMFEHVGHRNYRTYMDVVRRHLRPEGLFLLHTIGRHSPRGVAEPWVGKYIFPNSQIPALSEVANSMEGRFVLEDLHNFGADYDRTLMAWYENFEAGWPELRGKYDVRFHRMWRYFLLCCAGAFRARRLQLWQMVLSGQGVHEGYLRVS